jgi:hypothetical protein
MKELFNSKMDFGGTGFESVENISQVRKFH